MPYIITTSRRIDLGPVSVGSLDGSEHAVATLDEALQAVADQVREENGRLAGTLRHLDALLDQITTLPDSGGTIGPLPDGTIIEVQRTSWPVLAHAAGVGGWSRSRDPSQAAVLDAFNARS